MNRIARDLGTHLEEAEIMKQRTEKIERNPQVTASEGLLQIQSNIC